MNIIVLLKFVPDLVEDLEIDSQSGLLDRSFLRLIPNELDAVSYTHLTLPTIYSV